MLLNCLLFVTLMVGCSETKESKESNWEEFVKDNPELETNEKEISEDILKQIKVPKYTTIPFEVKKVQIMPTQTGEIVGPLLISISFFGEKDALLISNLFVKENPPLASATETVKLNNGIEAQWHEQGVAKVLSWQDREGNVVIDLGIRSAPGETNDFTLNDFLEMANSIE